ncbi:hypothetical protein ELI03_14190 [Rhizobium leguminosarum]|uniref:Uncharacterized protein n=1 Tax=Rhizobium leguminosarum TaxID=384 RepID=A0A4V2IJA0_RHILE|nr:hypothetical protein [Rhizobium leguminosarum]TAX72816.1 hypothetical protein ELI03_14190 [Rhizobium leguminosarum]
MSDDEDSQVSVVAVSAPLFRDGFNHIQVFTSDDQVPLGVQIDEYRYDTVSIRAPKRRRIRFYGADKRDQLLDAQGHQVLASLKSEPSKPYRELSKAFAPEKILELEFMGHLKIDRTVSFTDKTWRVSAR